MADERWCCSQGRQAQSMVEFLGQCQSRLLGGGQELRPGESNQRPLHVVLEVNPSPSQPWWLK